MKVVFLTLFLLFLSSKVPLIQPPAWRWQKQPVRGVLRLWVFRLSRYWAGSHRAGVVIGSQVYIYLQPDL